MELNNIVTIDAMKWHRICHELEFEDPRTYAFEAYFACKVKWKSRLDEWDGEDPSLRPNSVMILTFDNPADASSFVIKWL